MDTEKAPLVAEEEAMLPSAEHLHTEPLLNASNDSESFETWTLVVDTTKEEATPQPEQRDEEPKDEDSAKMDLLNVPERNADNDHSGDELSDGISIISESESPDGDRSSPDEELVMKDVQMQTAMNELPVEDIAPVYDHSDDELSFFPEPVRRNLPMIFKIIVCLALVAFVSKWKYPEWQPRCSPADTEPLRQRLDDMELHSNMLRAEIDILNRQVDYLNTQGIPDGKSFAAEKFEKKREKPQRREETVHVWTGNGKRVKQVEVPKKEMKTPFACDENEEDIGGFCVLKVGDGDMLSENLEQMKEDDEFFGKILESAELPRRKDDKKKFGNNQKDEKYKKDYNREQKHFKRDDNSGERYQKHKKDDHSGERYQKYKKEDNSGEKFREYKEKKRDDHSREDFSGERYDKKGKYYKKYEKKHEEKRFERKNAEFSP